MPERLEFEINCLTPLFTGGIDTNCDCLHETGIIGSMRWWFEAIVRGLGGDACDPTTHQCNDEKYCDACTIFGTTGLKRAFRIDWKNIKNENKNGQLGIKVNNNRGWFLKNGLMKAKFSGSLIYPLRPLAKTDMTNDDMRQILRASLKLASDWGGLGARTQQGYGVVRLIESEDLGFSLEGFNKLVRQNKGHTSVSRPNLPRLDEFFFARIRFNPGTDDLSKWIQQFRNIRWGAMDELNEYLRQGVIPLAPIVRYYLRSLIRNNWQHNNGKELRHQLMGHVNGNRSKSKSLINVSHAYQVTENAGEYEFRMWGWLPEKIFGGFSRSECLEKLNEWIKKDGILWDKNHCNINVSDVDFVQRQQQESPQDFLTYLCSSEVKQ